MCYVSQMGNEYSHDVDMPELRAHIARQGKRLWQGAVCVGVSPSTLSDWLNCRTPSPPGLRVRLERWLGLTPGTLKRENAGPV